MLIKKLKELECLEKENTQLSHDIVLLKDKLATQEHPQNSNNSLFLLLKNENRPFKSKSLRKKTGLKPSGQKGNEGNTLVMVSAPDEIIDYVSAYCKFCILSLND